MIRSFALALVATLALASAPALAKHHNSPSPAPSADATASSTPQSGTVAPVSTASRPACIVTDPLVWVNSKSNIYYTPGETYYGRTKKGYYACQSDAVKKGARPPKHPTGSKPTDQPHPAHS